MYEDLMRELMCCPDVEYGCSRCEYKSSLHCRESLMKQAADAIEELSKRKECPYWFEDTGACNMLGKCIVKPPKEET